MEELEYIIVALIVIGIIIWQILSFFDILSNINRLEHMFPEKIFNLSVQESENGEKTITTLAVIGDDFKQILDEINAYLQKVKNKTTDYHIIKDIVNRKAQGVEEQVDTMLSSPLYLGLMATISGVAVGVVFFAWDNLDALVNVNTSEINVEGLQVLLTDVGIAMIASFLGVLFTKLSTAKFKETSSLMSARKNNFLNWMLTDLMPLMTDDFSGALVKMTQDLNNFNNTFAQNTKELKDTLQIVSDNYEGQVELLEAIEKIEITKIANANIKVYDKLKGCTDEIELLFKHLGQSEEYVKAVVLLNDKLGSIEERTRAFEEVGNYFKNEIEYVKDRQGMMRTYISSLDSALQDSLSNLSTSVKDSISDLKLTFQRQNQSVQSLIEEQQQSLSETLNKQRTIINLKLAEFNDPFSGLKDVYSEIANEAKTGIQGINEAFEKQNKAINEMLHDQRERMTKEIDEHRKGVLNKLNEIPTQFKSLSQTANAIEKLEVVMNSFGEDIRKQNATMEDLLLAVNNMPALKSSIKNWQYWLLVVGIAGVFVLLLSILVVQLFDFKIQL